MLKKLIPDLYVSSIFDIPYNKLYESGKRIILTDLDNTLISYKETEPTEELFTWKNMVLNLGFEVIIVSNSRKNRVKHFASILGFDYVKFALKPTKIGLKKALKKASRKYEIDEVVELGDQLLTDVYGSKRLGLFTVLVEAIDKKTEKLVTRHNRFWEKKALKKLKKKYPKEYEEKLGIYARRNFKL